MLSETLLGIIIGGAIGILPTLFQTVVSFCTESRRERHELRMRRLDLVESPRMATLADYADQLGFMLTGAFDNAHSHELFLAAHQKALLFVSSETRSLMNAALPVILAGMVGDYPDIPRRQRVESEAIARLSAALRREMSISCDQAFASDHVKVRKHPEHGAPCE